MFNGYDGYHGYRSLSQPSQRYSSTVITDIKMAGEFSDVVYKSLDNTLEVLRKPEVCNMTLTFVKKSNQKIFPALKTRSNTKAIINL